MLSRALYQLLTTTAPLAALVGNRVYPGLLPPAPVLPAVTFDPVSGAAHYHMGGASGLRDRRVQFDVWARTADERDAVGAALIATLSAYAGTVAGVAIQGAFLELDRDEYDPATEKAGPRLWRKTCDFNIWHQEAQT